MTAQELAEKFLNSFPANFFPNIDSDAGTETVNELAAYVLGCYGDVLANCPKDFECFAVHYMADTLTQFNFLLSEDSCDPNAATPDGSSVQLPSDIAAPITFLKKKTIGGKTCEFEVIDSSMSGKWRALWQQKLEACRNPKLFIYGGTFQPQPKKGGCCDVH